MPVKREVLIFGGANAYDAECVGKMILSLGHNVALFHDVVSALPKVGELQARADAGVHPSQITLSQSQAGKIMASQAYREYHLFLDHAVRRCTTAILIHPTVELPLAYWSRAGENGAERILLVQSQEASPWFLVADRVIYGTHSLMDHLGKAPLVIATATPHDLDRMVDDGGKPT